jgi:hypothetical protein
MSTDRRTVIGALLWVAFVALEVRGMQQASWAYALLLFAALVLVPLLFDLVLEGDEVGGVAPLATWVRRIQLPAAMLLALACTLRSGASAALLALPWIAVTFLLGTIGARRAGAQGWRRPLGKLCADLGLMYAAIGGVWLFADRSGLRPLGFAADVVALTAIHFHFAGLILPGLGGLVLRRYPESRFGTRAAVGIVLGVPAVALGITTTQLGWGLTLEAAAGWGLALSGMAMAILYVRMATEAFGSTLARWLWGVTGASLFFAMLLAGFYAMRGFVGIWPWLTLPWMRAVHGTLNAFGFALSGVLAWRIAARGTPR